MSFSTKIEIDNDKIKKRKKKKKKENLTAKWHIKWIKSMNLN